jgi:S-formylglutathione hydrolase
MEQISLHHAFGGTQGVYTHASAVCGVDMTFSVYVPPHAPERGCRWCGISLA